MTVALAVHPDACEIKRAPLPLRRTLDAETLNAAGNHPEVFPHLGLTGEPGDLDVSGLVANPANVAMANEHGGFIGENLGNGTYEVHSLFTPEGRIGLARATAQGLRYLFTATDCMKVVTKVPACNRPAAALARVSGFVPVFDRADAWGAPDGVRCAVSYQAITFDQWKARDPELEAEGHRFHDALETTKAAAGSELSTHPDDPAHDRAVGAAALMIRAGNVAKAVVLYNEWARFAGYAPITLLSLTPPIIDVLDAVVTARDGEMEILSCR